MDLMSDKGPTTLAPLSDDTRIGLCLSGGGFRAALYGLGVVRYLAEAGVLGQVEAISAVSGGAVAATVLADRWPRLAAAGFTADAFVREVERPFHQALAEHNMRNEAIRRWARRRLSGHGRSRGSAMGDVLVERLVGARTVCDLDPALQIVITSTDLATGRAFRVSRDFIGSWDFGYDLNVPAGLSLGKVVAGSTAVPMLFPPVRLLTNEMKLGEDVPDELSLVDGGVYDNLGLEWFQGWNPRSRPKVARPVDFHIVVDGSGPFIRDERPLRGWRAVSRSRQIQYFQTRSSRIRWFVDNLRDGRMKGLYLVSKHDPCTFGGANGGPIPASLYEGALPKGFGSDLASLRTDLDRFFAYESNLLAYHGYWSAHARMSVYASELAVPGQLQWQDYRDLDEPQVARLRVALASGRGRKVLPAHDSDPLPVASFG